MKGRNFFLKPFPSDAPQPALQITGRIERSSNILSVSYELLGHIRELELPAPAEQQYRKNSLWEGTCFELFLGEKNSGRYWEFNISPAGHWNVYRFNDYREGMREEPAITSLPINRDHRPEELRLSLNIRLEDIVPADQALEASVCAVIKPVNGPTLFWALVDPGTQADFHRRDGFIIEL